MTWLYADAGANVAVGHWLASVGNSGNTGEPHLHVHAQGRGLLATRCGPIESPEAGPACQLLVLHGSGGGHDQGMAWAGRLASHGWRAIGAADGHPPPGPGHRAP